MKTIKGNGKNKYSIFMDCTVTEKPDRIDYKKLSYKYAG